MCALRDNIKSINVVLIKRRAASAYAAEVAKTMLRHGL